MKQLLIRLAKHLTEWWFIYFFLIIYLFATNLVVLNRWWQFEGFYYDHGIFDSALWQIAHFQTPLIEHLELRPISHLADHFTPTFYLFAPIYWLTSKYEALLIFGTSMVSLSALILFFIAKKRIESKIMVFALVLAYTLYVGLQNTLIANFHTELITVVTLSLCLLFIDHKKWKLYLVFLLLTLGTKENFASIGVGLAFYLWILRKREMGIATAIISLSYYFIVTKLVIPYFGNHEFMYSMTVPTNPLYILKNLFTPEVKLQTIIVSLLTFGLSPLFGFAFYPLIFQDFFTRFVVNTGPSRWDLGMHYNATLAVLLTYGSIIGISWLLKNKFYRKLIIFHAILIIISVLYIQRFYYHGPLGLAYNQDFYKNTKNMEFLNKFINSVPKTGLVMGPNNLIVHLTHEHQVMFLRSQYWLWSPDIIILDLRLGQSENNYWPEDYNGLVRLKEKLSEDTNYESIGKTSQQYIFVKKH